MVRNLSVFLIACAVLAVGSQVFGVPEKDGGDPTAGATYVGANDCKKCHFKEYRSWKKMKHAKAWDAIKDTLKSPDQKDDKGRLCVSCHVTGYGEKGGFESIEKSAHLLGVQCESCHGPGSKHVEAGKKLTEEKRKEFRDGEPSYIVLRTTNCANCHNPHVEHADVGKMR